MDETVKRLRLGWTLCPASLTFRPWFMTWSAKVALMSSEIMFRARPLPPRPPLCLCPPLPPLPLPLALAASMLASSQNGLTEAFLQLPDWCSVLEESVLRCVSKYSQLTNVFRILNRCVFPMVQ